MKRLLAFGMFFAACGPVDLDIVFDLDPPEFRADDNEETAPKPLCENAYEGDVRASNLAEVENAIAASGACAIKGNLVIDADLANNASTALRSIKEVQGNLTIARAMTGDVLGSLQRVTGQVTIEGFGRGLGALSDVGALKFVGTYGMAVQGFASLTRIRGSLELRAIQSLDDLLPLSGIAHIGGSLVLDNVRPLSTLRGLEGVRSIGGQLSVQQMSTLTTLGALAEVQSIGAVVVRDAPALVGISFPKVTSLNLLQVESNTALESISLPAIRSISDASTIKRNAKLSRFELPALTSAPGGLSFCFNAPSLQSDIDAITGRIGRDKVQTCR